MPPDWQSGPETLRTIPLSRRRAKPVFRLSYPTSRHLKDQFQVYPVSLVVTKKNTQRRLLSRSVEPSKAKARSQLHREVLIPPRIWSPVNSRRHSTKSIPK